MIRLFTMMVMLLMSLGTNAQTKETASLTYDTFFLEAIVQRQKGNNDAAFDLLQHCIKLNPKAAEAYYFLAQYYQLLKNDSLAGQNYLKAAELEPDNTVFLETVAQWYVTISSHSTKTTRRTRRHRISS